MYYIYTYNLTTYISLETYISIGCVLLRVIFVVVVVVFIPLYRALLNHVLFPDIVYTEPRIHYEKLEKDL